MKYLAAVLVALFPSVLDAGSKSGLDIDRALQSASSRHQVPLRLLKAICTVESNLNPKAINKYDGGSSSYGLCQVKYTTAKYLGYRYHTANNLFNPYINANYAAKYLHRQLSRYSGDWVMAVSAYNRGTARSPVTNRKYVNKVLSKATRL